MLLGAEGCALVPVWTSRFFGKRTRDGESVLGHRASPAVSARGAGARADPEGSDLGTDRVTVHLLCSLGLRSPNSHVHTGEQRSSRKWFFPTGDSKDCVFVTLVGSAIFPSKQGKLLC